MEFKPQDVSIVNEILNYYIAKQGLYIEEESDSLYLISDKGRDPIISDLIFEKTSSNIFNAQRIKNVITDLEKLSEHHQPKHSHSSFAEIVGGFDGPIGGQQKLESIETWIAACKEFKDNVFERQKRMNSIVKDSGVNGVSEQLKEANLNFSELLQRTYDIEKTVSSFIKEEKPKKKLGM